MAGSNRRLWGPIHPAPSAWLVREVRSSFRTQPNKDDKLHPRFAELVNFESLRAMDESPSYIGWAETHWDTAEKPWFEAAIHEKAALVDAPDFRHFWLGSAAHSLPIDQLCARFPELGQWLVPPRNGSSTRHVDACHFRRDVQRHGNVETARCELIRQITNVADFSLCEIRREVCAACCESSNPSRSSVNPPIATSLYQLARRIVDRGGVAGCDPTSAAHVRRFAESQLEFRLPGEGATPVPRNTDRPCVHLGEEIGFRIRPTAAGHERDLVHDCRHPDHIDTTIAECGRCHDWSDRLGSAALPIEQLVPPPEQRAGKRVRHWAVGVTTAPRPKPTIDACLDSLIQAGWESPRLFVDSAVTIAERFHHLPVTFRETKLGAWPNYYMAIVELLMREPNADAFMLVQDDIIFDHRHHMREYLEEILWPADPIGAVSLYCSKAYTQPRAGWHAMNETWVWGALAFVFSRESAKRFVTDRGVVDHRSDPGEGLIQIDMQIGIWARRQSLPIYFPTPSLVQHIGDSSSIWLDPHSRAFGERRADRFVGDITQVADAHSPDP